MAPNPLRGAFAFLLFAALAAPASAGDVALPGEIGNTGSGSGQAGSITGGGAGVNTGVNAIPSLSLGLNPSLQASGTPIPLSAAATPDKIVPGARQRGALATPVKTSVDPAATPVKAAAPQAVDEDAVTQPVKVKPKNPMTQVLKKEKPLPPAIDRPSHGSASAGEIDAELLGGQSKPASKPASDADLKALYDGARDWKGDEETGMFLTIKDEPVRRSGLAPAGTKGAANSKVGGPFAPAPPAGTVREGASWFKKAKGKVAGKASKLWNGFVEYLSEPKKIDEPTIVVLPPVKTPAAMISAVEESRERKAKAAAGDAAKRTTETVVVRAARGARFLAQGYKVLFTKPGGNGVEATREKDEELSVRLEREGEDARTELLRAHFARFNELIETNFAALELIAQNSSKMTVKTSRSVGSLVWEMSRKYWSLVQGDEDRVRDAEAIQNELRRIATSLAAATQGLADNDPLPANAVELVMPIDKPSLHHFINQIHQKALDALGRANNGSPANLTVKLGQGDAERKVSLVDLSERPIVADGRVVAPGFKALLAAMAIAKDTPKGSLIMQDHQFWGHFKLGAHSAEVYSSFLPPDEGGMIRVRYQEWGTGYDNLTRLYYVGRLLHKAGFHVEQENGFLTAVIDKDHASQTVDEMTDTFALIVQALHATVGVDFALPLLVQGAKSSEEVGARIDEWVDTVMGEGTLPFYVHDDQNAMIAGWHEYEAAKRQRAALRASLDANLTALGLPAIPSQVRLGQRTIDRFVSEPIEAAIARGELALTPDGRLARVTGWDPLASLAGLIAADSASAARMAEVVSSLDPALFKYETIGSLGSLTVERAQRRFDPDSWVTIHVLRDPKTGQIGLARAEISSLKPGEKPSSLSPAALFNQLKAQGHPVASFKPSEDPPGAGYFLRLLKETRVVRAGFGRRFQGLAASPGHGRTMVARVTYDKTLAARGGYIFVAPYTTPDDLDAIRGSKAVITTSGGLLSHAAITTREMGIPAAILPRVEWKDGVASLHTFGLGKERPAGPLVARDAKSEAPVVLAEGDLVRLDPATGVVETFPSGVAAPLLDAAAALERYDADGDAAGLALIVRARAKSQALQFQQKAILVREILAGAFARTAADTRKSGLLSRLLSALPGPDDVLGKWARDSVDGLFAAEVQDALGVIKEQAEVVEESLSAASLERATGVALARVAGLRAIASELGVPKAKLVSVDMALERLRSVAAGKHQKLLAEELSELQLHARLFPAATVEALPRIKAAIGKARRRGMDPALIRTWEEQAARLEETRRRAMEKEAPTAISLAAVLDVDVPWVGGKAAKLGEIAAVVRAAGGEVPPGIALTVHAYRRFLAESGIEKPLAKVGNDKSLTPDERAARARMLIGGSKLVATSGVGKDIVEALRAQGLDKVMLAVRSSAVDEDGAEAAFAGAGDTHLYVSPEELLEHVKDVWLSLWNPRALLYRETKGLSTSNLAQAVVIQSMAHSEVSGVAFTQDPVSGSSGRVIVNAAFGLGEGIVSGRVAPDQYTLSKTEGREILPPMISDKKLAIVRGESGKGTVEHKMPAEWRRRRSMTPGKLKTLSDVSVALENHFGYALDIEFGFVGDQLYILQARPVTNTGGAEQVEVPAPPTGSQMKPAAKPTQRRLMLVCTGNTCRSPMAAHLAREKLWRHGRPDIEVISRGLQVVNPGQGMFPTAKETLEAMGVDAEGHQSRQLAESEIAGTSLILTMTDAQAAEVIARFPKAKGKTFSLAAFTGVGGDIADPYGRDEDAYKAAAIEIGDALDAFVSQVPKVKPNDKPAQ